MKEYFPLSEDPHVVEVNGDILPSYTGDNEPKFYEKTDEVVSEDDDIFTDLNPLEIRAIEMHFRYGSSCIVPDKSVDKEPDQGNTHTVSNKTVEEIDDEEHIRSLHDELPSDDNRSMWRRE